ncbi:MAG: hypothetical protein ACRYG8_26285 [Janthinobacterium lividum]
MTKFHAGDLARQKPHLTCADCEKEVGNASPTEQWIFLVNFYYHAKCAHNEGLY